jgi:8-oxo-dGTP pyrophosphatase MutT (NUDIX family)
MTDTHLTVAAVIEKKGRFLVVEELVGAREVINQPAGHVEPGETLREAVIREVLEETAWQFSPTAITGVYLWQQPVTGERFLRVTFCGNCQNHAASQPLDEGIMRTLWLSRNELVKRTVQLRSPMVLKAIDDYNADIRYPVNMFQHLELEDLAQHALRVK